jgi:hypothetical protein
VESVSSVGASHLYGADQRSPAAAGRLSGELIVERQRRRRLILVYGRNSRE